MEFFSYAYYGMPNRLLPYNSINFSFFIDVHTYSNSMSVYASQCLFSIAVDHIVVVVGGAAVFGMLLPFLPYIDHIEYVYSRFYPYFAIE